MLHDTVSDLFTRIRNAQMVKKGSLRHPMSNLALAVVSVMVTEGYLSAVRVVDMPNSIHKELEVFLKYSGGVEGKPGIHKLRRVSKPSRRVYTKVDELPKSYNGLGTYILSTSQGVMSCHEARKKRLGGEVLGEVF